MIVIIIGCESHNLYVSDPESKHHNFTSMAGFRKIMREIVVKYNIKGEDDLMIMCSSSMDFPEEYTSNKRLLNLVKKLRP